MSRLVVVIAGTTIRELGSRRNGDASDEGNPGRCQCASSRGYSHRDALASRNRYYAGTRTIKHSARLCARTTSTSWDIRGRSTKIEAARCPS